jgi:Family of unknown function (DUF5946)
MSQQCPDCGAEWRDDKTCEDDFHQMLFWEGENPSYWAVHHLMVLCYHLQHPCLYSADGLAEGKRLLVEFVQNGVSPQEVRRLNKDRVDSGKRTWKIKATATSKGTYANPIQWTMTAADVTAGGPESYCDSVRKWAQSTFEALKASGNI